MKKIIYLAALLSFGVAMPAMANKDMDKNMRGDRGDYYFNKADTNGDGMVSREENEAFAEMKFNEADKNDDGMISRNEMRAQHKKYYSKNSGRVNPDDNLNPASGQNRSNSTKQSETLDTQDKRDQ